MKKIGKKTGTEMKYEFKIKDLSKKYFGDLVSEDKMDLKNKKRKAVDNYK